MGGHAFSARRALDLAHLRHGGTDCGKTHFQVPQRLKPCSYESTYRSAGSAAPPQTGVFRSQLMLCPATSWQNSGAVILIEAKDPCITNQLHRSFAAWRPLRMTASEI